MLFGQQRQSFLQFFKTRTGINLRVTFDLAVRVIGRLSCGCRKRSMDDVYGVSSCRFSLRVHDVDLARLSDVGGVELGHSIRRGFSSIPWLCPYPRTVNRRLPLLIV